MIVYNSEQSPNSLKVRITLLELGIEAQLVELEYATLAEPEFRAKFAGGKVPALEDGELRLSESGAINMYLADKHGALIPQDLAGRALMHQAMHVEAAQQGPTVGGQGIFGEFGKPEQDRDMARVAKLMPQAQHVAQLMGALLGDKEYFAGTYSIGDIQLYPGAVKAIGAQVYADPPANLVAWAKRVGERAAVLEACKHYVHYR